jgi:hypothetical protein
MTVKGTIVASRLAYAGQNEIPYGYIDLVTGKNEHIHFKVDANTKHGKLDTGLRVEADLEYLGNSKILRAKTIITAEPTGADEAKASA